MTVTPTGRLTFEVTSRSNQPPYHVDIGMIRVGGVCNGRCDCSDFKYNIAPKIRALKAEGNWKPGDAWRCAHIRAARNYAFDEMLDLLVTSVRKEYDDYPGRDDEV